MGVEAVLPKRCNKDEYLVYSSIKHGGFIHLFLENMGHKRCSSRHSNEKHMNIDEHKTFRCVWGAVQGSRRRR